MRKYLTIISIALLIFGCKDDVTEASDPKEIGSLTELQGNWRLLEYMRTVNGYDSHFSNDSVITSYVYYDQTPMHYSNGTGPVEFTQENIVDFTFHSNKIGIMTGSEQQYMDVEFKNGEYTNLLIQENIEIDSLNPFTIWIFKEGQYRISKDSVFSTYHNKRVECLLLSKSNTYSRDGLINDKYEARSIYIEEYYKMIKF